MNKALLTLTVVMFVVLSAGAGLAPADEASGLALSAGMLAFAEAEVIPEPVTMLTVCAGVGGLGAYLRRRMRRH